MSKTNLWNKGGIPHKNWKPVGCVDLGKGNYTECGMCGRSEIRYAHEMSHINYKNLIVGCVCAEKMATGYNGTQAMSAFKKLRAREEAQQKRINKLIEQLKKNEVSQ
jgi:DNA helicase II / ATP-dependent DNA helicase PcrA